MNNDLIKQLQEADLFPAPTIDELDQRKLALLQGMDAVFNNFQLGDKVRTTYSDSNDEVTYYPSVGKVIEMKKSLGARDVPSYKILVMYTRRERYEDPKTWAGSTHPIHPYRTDWYDPSDLVKA